MFKKKGRLFYTLLYHVFFIFVNNKNAIFSYTDLNYVFCVNTVQNKRPFYVNMRE